jgi:hypothetical protein
MVVSKPGIGNAANASKKRLWRENPSCHDNTFYNWHCLVKNRLWRENPSCHDNTFHNWCCPVKFCF